MAVPKKKRSLNSRKLRYNIIKNKKNKFYSNLIACSNCFRLLRRHFICYYCKK